MNVFVGQNLQTVQKIFLMGVAMMQFFFWVYTIMARRRNFFGAFCFGKKIGAINVVVETAAILKKNLTMQCGAVNAVEKSCDTSGMGRGYTLERAGLKWPLLKKKTLQIYPATTANGDRKCRMIQKVSC